MSVLLFDVLVHDAVAGAPRWVRVGTHDYNHPSAPGFYRGAILSDATARVSRSVWSAEGEYGAGKLDIAEIPVANDGWLDWLVTNGAGYGLAARLRLLPAVTAPFAAGVPIAVGVVESAGHTWDRVTFRWRDPVAFLLDKAAQGVAYGGSNVLPDGVDGVDDLKGQWQPEWWGTCLNVAPPCVNTAKLVYQPSRRAMAALDAVYDKGAALTRGAARAGVAALLATAPAPGTWDYSLGGASEGCYIRLGSPPAGAVTVDGSEGAAGARTIGQLWARLLDGWNIGSVSPTAAAAADARQPGVVGLWLGTDQMQRRDALNRVLASGGFVTWVDQAGVWRLARAEAPAGTPVASFALLRLGATAAAGVREILEWEWLNPGDGTANPVYSVDLTYARNWTVQNRDALAGAALAPSAASRGLQWLGAEWRHAGSADDALLAACPLARQTSEETLFIDAEVAAAEALRRRLLRRDRRQARMKVAFDPALAGVVDLMSVVRVTLPRWGLAGGGLAVVRQIDPDWAAQTADLYLTL